MKGKEVVVALAENEGDAERRRLALRLTDRDRQLMGLLATTRYLTMEQLGRLLFAERSNINLHKRLLALAGEGRNGVPQPYLKRIPFRSYEGMPQTAWTLTALGCAVASNVLGTPLRPPLGQAGANFIEHGLLVNSLYVRMLELPLQHTLQQARAKAAGAQRASGAFMRIKAGLYARAKQPTFTWHSHDEVRLPWKEGNPRKLGIGYDRVILPDATVELHANVHVQRGKQRVWHPGRRVFIEGETGSHTIAATSPHKPGATQNKFERYRTFLTIAQGGSTDLTWYRKAFPDNYAPSLLFLVPTEQRAAAVNAMIRKRHEDIFNRREPIDAAAMTVEAAAVHLAGIAPAPPFEEPFTQPQAKMLFAFAHAAHLALHELRAAARTRGQPVPDYPPQIEELRALTAHRLKKVP